MNIIQDIQRRLAEELDGFRVAFYTEPEGLLLGPVEYISLCTMGGEGQYGNTDYYPQITEFHGIKIYPKSSPGIEFLLPHSQVPRFASAEPEKQTTPEDRYHAKLKKLRGL